MSVKEIISVPIEKKGTILLKLFFLLLTNDSLLFTPFFFVHKDIFEITHKWRREKNNVRWSKGGVKIIFKICATVVGIWVWNEKIP